MCGGGTPPNNGREWNTTRQRNVQDTLVGAGISINAPLLGSGITIRGFGIALFNFTIDPSHAKIANNIINGDPRYGILTKSAI